MSTDNLGDNLELLLLLFKLGLQPHQKGNSIVQ